MLPLFNLTVGRGAHDGNYSTVILTNLRLLMFNQALPMTNEKYLPDVQKVMGSNPVGDSDFFSEFIYVCYNYSFKTEKNLLKINVF